MRSLTRKLIQAGYYELYDRAVQVGVIQRLGTKREPWVWKVEGTEKVFGQKCTTIAVALEQASLAYFQMEPVLPSTDEILPWDVPEQAAPPAQEPENDDSAASEPDLGELSADDETVAAESKPEGLRHVQQRFVDSVGNNVRVYLFNDRQVWSLAERQGRVKVFVAYEHGGKRYPATQSQLRARLRLSVQSGETVNLGKP